MTHDEAINHIADQLRLINTDARIPTWLTLALDEVGIKYDFNELKKYSSTTTSVGVPDLTMPADFHRLYIGMELPTQNRNIWPEDEKIIKEANPDYRTRQGQINCYYLAGPLLVGLWLVPDGTHTVNFSYQARAGSIISMPLEWHSYITQIAISKGHRADANDAGLQTSLAEERRLKREIGTSSFKRPDNPTVVGVSNNRSRRPGRPKLPSNYPRGS